MRLSALWNALILLAAAVSGIGFFACQQPPVQPSPMPSPAKESSLLRAADAAYEEGDLDLALKRYSEWVSTHPWARGTDWALFRSARIFDTKREFRRAVEASRRLIRDFPNSPFAGPAGLILSRNLIKLGYLEEARRALDVAKPLLRGERDRLEEEIIRADLLEREGRRYEALSTLAKLYDRCGADQQKDVRDRCRRWAALVSDSQLNRLYKEFKHSGLAGYLLYERCLRFSASKEWGQARTCFEAFLHRFPRQETASVAEKKLEEATREYNRDRRKIGCVLPLSGKYATYGKRVFQGMLLALKAFDPGFRERMPSLLCRDSGSRPDQAAEAVRSLVRDEHVLAVAGPMGPRAARAAARVAQKEAVPIVTLTQAERIGEEGPYVFRNFLTDTDQARALIRYAYLVRGIERFAVLYPENEYGRRFARLFEEEVRAHFLDLVALESYDPHTRDFSGAVERLIGEKRWARYVERLKTLNKGSLRPTLSLEFQALFIPDDYHQILLIAPQLAYHDTENVLLLGTNLWNSSLLAEKGGKYLRNAVFVADFYPDPAGASCRRFVEEYQREFGEKPGFFAALGYDTVTLLSKVLQQAVPSLTPDAVRSGLLQLNGFNGLTGRISFDAAGDSQREVRLLTVRRDRIVPVD